MNMSTMIDYIAFRAATRYLKKHGMYDEIHRLQKEHKSTGVSLIDFAALYEYVKRYRPRKVLECGTGLSTHILAAAMKRYCLPVYDDIKLVSMEGEPFWHQESVQRFPSAVYDFVEIKLSEVVDYRQYFITGKMYKDVPEMDYDFVFVDGPAYEDTCDIDFIRIVSQSEKPVGALIDSRKTSVVAYAAVLGREKMKAFPFGFTLVEGVSKDDLILRDRNNLHRVFYNNIPASKSMFIRGFLSALMLCFMPMRLTD